MTISSAIFFVSACFSRLMILQLDITFYTMRLKKQQIFFTTIAAVCSYFFQHFYKNIENLKISVRYC